MVDNTNYMHRNYEYNTLTGKWQRVTIVNDFQQIAGRVGSAATTELTIASGTPSSNKDMYITAISFTNEDSGTACAYAFTLGNSTIGYGVAANGTTDIINSTKDYLAKVGNGESFKILAVNPVSNGTYSAFATGTRKTIDSKIEP